MMKNPLKTTLKDTARVSHSLICIALTTYKLCTSLSYSGGGDRDGRDWFSTHPSGGLRRTQCGSLIKALWGWRWRDSLLWRLSGKRGKITGYISALWRWSALCLCHTHTYTLTYTGKKVLWRKALVGVTHTETKGHSKYYIQIQFSFGL